MNKIFYDFIEFFDDFGCKFDNKSVTSEVRTHSSAVNATMHYARSSFGDNLSKWHDFIVNSYKESTKLLRINSRTLRN